MESLRPERDELDRFKNRKNKSPNSPDSSKPRVVSKKQGKGLSFVVVLLVLLVCGSSVLALVYMRQQTQLVSLKTELDNAIGFIGQSKLLLARLEGELSETDAELEQSGSAAQSKLAFLDSEMRKLWGVSNDRNKKLIQSNTDAVTGLEQRLLSVVTSQKKAAASAEALYSTLNQSLASLERSVGQLESRVSANASDAVIARVEQEEAFNALRQDVAGVTGLKDAVGENKKAISSIDASRRQLNERIVELDRKLNAIQLQLSNAEKPAHVQ